VKLKDSEVSKAEAKFLKMKAWSKSRIRQLEQELKKVQVRILHFSSDLHLNTRLNLIIFFLFLISVWSIS